MHQRRKGINTSHGGYQSRLGGGVMRQGSMARSKSPSNATDGIMLAKETFKITGNN